MGWGGHCRQHGQFLGEDRVLRDLGTFSLPCGARPSPPPVCPNLLPPFPWDGPDPGSPQRRAPLLRQAGVADLEKPTPGSAPSCPDIQKAWALRGGGSEPQGNSGPLCSEGGCPGSLGVWGAGGLWLEQEVTSVQVAPSQARILWEDNEVEQEVPLLGVHGGPSGPECELPWAAGFLCGLSFPRGPLRAGPADPSGLGQSPLL